MAHNTSGLPPLNLEPFDPSDLYAAARSNNGAHSAGRRTRVSPVSVGLGVLAVLILALGASALFN